MPVTRIYIFLGRLGSGGAQRQLLQLAAGARDRGHPVRLGVIEPGGRYWEEASGTGLAEALWPERSRVRAIRAWRYLRAYRRLRESVVEFGADVLYTALYPANAAGWAAARPPSAPPLVWGIRASDVPRTWPRELWIRVGAAVSSDVDLAIANSAAGRRHHRNRGYRPRSWSVVHNGIDTDRFRPDPRGRRRLRREWNLADDQPLVGLVGRLDPMKGHEHFLGAAARVHADRPRTRFVCVGSGPEEKLRTLKERTDDLGIAGAVRWAGQRRDMRAVYSALDLLVLASSCGEGFPNVVGEAMACGTPCIVTAVGDAPEIVGPLGDVVPPERPERMARAVVDRLGPGGARGDDGETSPVAMGSRAAGALRRRIVERFSLDRFVDRTLELLERVAVGDSRDRGEVSEPS